VSLDELVTQRDDLIDGEFCRGVRVQHGRLIDGILAPGEGRLNGELLHVDVRAIECGALGRQVPHVGGRDARAIGHAHHLHGGTVGQVGDEARIQHIAPKSKGHAGLDGLQDVGGIFVPALVLNRPIGQQLGPHVLPALNLLNAPPGVFVQRNPEAFDELRCVLADEPGHVLCSVLTGLGHVIAKPLHQLKPHGIARVVLGQGCAPLDLRIEVHAVARDLQQPSLVVDAGDAPAQVILREIKLAAQMFRAYLHAMA